MSTITYDTINVSNILTVGAINLQETSGPLLRIPTSVYVRDDISGFGVLKTRKGYIKIGHAFENTWDKSRIVLTTCPATGTELYIRQNSGSLGDIRVRNATTDSIVLNTQTSDPSELTDGKMWFRSDL